MTEIVGIGIDLCDCARVERMLADHSDAFLDRVLTPSERTYCLAARGSTDRVAARYAAKEALLKSLGTGLRDGMAWTEIEVAHDALGAPTISVRGEVARAATALGVDRFLITLSHAGGMAIAQVMAVRCDPTLRAG